MNDLEGTKQCPNCKLDILCTNYTIHYVHCQRNFYLCSKCERPVNYEKRVEHEANHVAVRCNSCQLALDNYHLDDHLINNCPNRKIKCQICDIDVKAVDITEHEDYCGSRTEKCTECQEFVMLKYKALHTESNHTFIKLSDEPGPSPSWQYGRRTLCNFIPDLSSKNYKSASVGKRKSYEFIKKPKTPGRPSESKNESDKMNKSLHFSDNVVKSNAFKEIGVRKSPRKDTDEWPALSSLRSLQISEEKQDNAETAGASNWRPNGVNEESDLMYAIQMSQEINSEIWRKDSGAEDEIFKNFFKPLAQNKSAAGKSIEKNMFEKKIEAKEQPNFAASKNDFSYFYEKQESVKLPCEFCGKLILSNDLILHQNRCSFHTMDNCSRSAAYELPFFHEDADKKIACGMCNKFFRLSLLENHQLHCQRNSIKSSKYQNFSKNLKAVNVKSEPGLQNGLESSSPKLTRMGTRSEWLSELPKSSKGEQHSRISLNCPDSGTTTKGPKVSSESRRAPLPPG